jgi:hypothetical protein
MPDELTQLSDQDLLAELLKQTALLLEAYRTRAHILSMNAGYWTVPYVSDDIVKASYDLLGALYDMGVISRHREGKNPWT